MGHERSITLQDEAGNWYNAYGPGNDSGREVGERLPLTPNYPTSDEAVKAARERSRREGPPPQPKQKEGNAVLGRRADYTGPQLLSDPRPRSFANFRLSDDAARAWAAHLDAAPAYQPTPAAQKVIQQTKDEDLTRARRTEITEDMSPAERDIVMRGGRDMHTALLRAGAAGVPAGYLSLARPGFSDPTLQSIDHAAMILGAVPGVQSNVAARTGLLKGAQPTVKAGADMARHAGPVSPTMNRLAGLDLLIQQLRRTLGSVQ